MTEKRMSYRTKAPSQALMAMADEATVAYWLGGIGEKSNAQLLELYWGVTNRTALSGRKLTGQEQRLSRRTRLEMLRRVDNRTFPAPALPDSVYKTWCGICWQEKLSNWEVPCGNACEVVEPYGWVPEAGCPVHDADEGLVNDDEV